MNVISLSRWYITRISISSVDYVGGIVVWKNMAFYIKVWDFPYFAIKVHIFMDDLLSRVSVIRIGKKPIDNISRDWYTKNVQKIYW